MNIDASILTDSISLEGIRLTTMEATYPRFIHAEALRHRMFSRSVASSRAIPTERIIEQVTNDPFVPVTFNERVKGMGVGTVLEGTAALTSRKAWLYAKDKAVQAAHILVDQNNDKSRVNRLLEPFMWLTEIITATEWDNFFGLRDHEAAQPEFQTLARQIREVYEDGAGKEAELHEGEWHMPLTELGDEFIEASETGNWDTFKRISASRVARVSYVRHQDEETHEETLKRATRLIDAIPPHLSPAEHVARPFNAEEREVLGTATQPVINASVMAAVRGDEVQARVYDTMIRQMEFCGNFRGWVQFRAEIPYQDNALEAIRAGERTTA